MVIRGVVFDVDDTLYFEREYVRSGFLHVARLAGTSSAEREALAMWLEQAFVSGVRGDTFRRLLDAFPALAARTSVPALIEAYRRHLPEIELASGAVETLERLKATGRALAILTDGPLESQRAKVQALALDRWFDPVILTEAYGGDFVKPGTAGFEAIARRWAMTPGELCYVADNPEKDFAGPRRLGWLTVRLRSSEQLRVALEAPSAEFEPELEVTTLAAVADLLDADCRTVGVPRTVPGSNPIVRAARRRPGFEPEMD